ESCGSPAVVLLLFKEPAAMSIQMACPGCGASYTLADELKGKKIRCKKCEQIFAVNGVAKRAVDEAIEPAEKVRTGPRPVAATGRRRGEDGGSPMRSGARAPGKPVRRRGEDADDEAPEPAKKGAPAKPSGSKMPLLIGGAGLGVLVLVGGIVLAVVMLNKDDDKPA